MDDTNRNAEKDRVGQHRKDSLLQLACCCSEEDHILSRKGQYKRHKKPQSEVCHKQFRTQHKHALCCHPDAPDEEGGLFAVFQRR